MRTTGLEAFALRAFVMILARLHKANEITVKPGLAHVGRGNNGFPPEGNFRRPFFLGGNKIYGKPRARVTDRRIRH
jgi:hypothetical protein